MPVIRITDPTWERLKKYAEPLEDTADDVLNKILDLADTAETKNWKAETKSSEDRSETKPGHLPPGNLLPQDEYTYPILEAIYELGGRAPTGQVLDIVWDKVKSKLTEFDLAPKKSGPGPVWRNRAEWQRNKLVAEGVLMKQRSPRGIWELSPTGINEVERHLRTKETNRGLKL